MNSPIVFSGRSNRPLARGICEYLGLEPGKILLQDHPDWENHVQVQENVRARDVFVVQSTCTPANDNLVELFIIIDALRRASAERITAVIPYFGYARQDRKDEPRKPITAKLMANLITTSGANRVLTMDLHASQIQGFFDIPVDHLFASKVMLEPLRPMVEEGNFAIATTDIGGIKTADAYAKRLNCPKVVVDKRRVDGSNTELIDVLGDPKGKKIFIADDMISTAGSFVVAAQALKERGAAAIYGVVTHPVLCGPAIQRLAECDFEELLVTDTIVLPPEKRSPKIRIVSVASLLGEAIKRIHNGESVNSLFA